MARGGGIWADIEQAGDLRESEFAPYVQDDDLALIVGKKGQSAAQIPFCGIVAVWRGKPCCGESGGVRIEGGVAIPNLGFVQQGVAHAGKQVGLFVEDMAQISVGDQFEEYLMKRILSTAVLTRDGRGEKQERRTVLAVERLDFGGFGAVGMHVSVSIV